MIQVTQTQLNVMYGALCAALQHNEDYVYAERTAGRTAAHVDRVVMVQRNVINAIASLVTLDNPYSG